MVKINRETRKKLDLYVKEIERLQPVRTEDLPFKKINYYFLGLLVNNKEIIKKKYGESYVLYVLPGYEHLAEERYRKDSGKPLRKDGETTDNGLNFKFDEIIETWLSQIPKVSISQGFVDDNFSEINPLDTELYLIKSHSLYFELKKKFEQLHISYPDTFSDPCIYLDKFIAASVRFFKKRDKLIQKIIDLITYDLGITMFPNLYVTPKLTDGILLRMNYGLNWGFRDFTDEWKDFFKQFHSSIILVDNSYEYYLRNFNDDCYFENIPINETEVKFEITDFTSHFSKKYFPISIFFNDSNKSIPKDVFKESIDLKVEKLLTHLSESKEILSDIKSLERLTSELNSYGEIMLKNLELFKNMKN
ncbi:hypothetical protein AYK24_07580 [Thermoplasmatales archaeon SG8-52-4]|nr:MAG: hypothetical protein AYK24_07580 [Thermoplasmatales archaeon SG8-52-4]